MVSATHDNRSITAVNRNTIDSIAESANVTLTKHNIYNYGQQQSNELVNPQPTTSKSILNTEIHKNKSPNSIETHKHSLDFTGIITRNQTEKINEKTHFTDNTYATNSDASDSPNLYKDF